jgi:hypothetical protein
VHSASDILGPEGLRDEYTTIGDLFVEGRS